MDTKQPEALAQECADYATSLRSTINVVQLEGREPPTSFLRAAELFERAAARIAALDALRASYDAALDEIASLQARVQELGKAARDVNSRRVQELETQLAAIGAGGAGALPPELASTARPASTAAEEVTSVPIKAGEYPPLVCDYCGALTPDPWHSSGMMNGKMSKHIHSCDSCAVEAEVQKQDEALIRQLVEALEVTASDVCQVAHHKKRDQHGNGDVCPVQARHDEAIAAGRARLESKP